MWRVDDTPSQESSQCTTVLGVCLSCLCDGPFLTDLHTKELRKGRLSGLTPAVSASPFLWSGDCAAALQIPAFDVNGQGKPGTF